MPQDDRPWHPHPADPPPGAVPSGSDDAADSLDDTEIDGWLEEGDDGGDGLGSGRMRSAGDGDAPDGAAGTTGDAPPAVPAKGRRGRKPKIAGGDPGLAIFVDSSALIALVDRDDATHGAATSAYTNLVTQGYKLFTTNYVIAETFDLLSAGVGQDIARRFLRECKIAIYHADEQDERRAKRVILRQTGPNGLSLTDAISFVVMERLNIGDAFAVDPNFLSNAP